MRVVRTLLRLLATACLAWGVIAPGTPAAELPEMDVKAAFLYNFALFTEWPPEVGPTVALCVIEGGAFRTEFTEFQGQPVGNRRFEMRHVPDAESTQGCQIVFLPRASAAAMSRSLRTLGGHRHLLTIGDSPEAGQAGVGINLVLKDARVTFDVNLKPVQDSGLNLSSKLLRLAQHVR